MRPGAGPAEAPAPESPKASRTRPAAGSAAASLPLHGSSAISDSAKRPAYLIIPRWPTRLYPGTHSPVARHSMDAHEVTDLLEARRRRGEAYLEFLRVASMSCGLYELPRGAEDKQSAHAEDEVYYVVRGRARIRVRSDDREVRPGSVVFVPARAEHRFHDIP